MTEDIAARILKAYGMSYKDMASVQNLSFSDSVEQMKDGRLDVLFWTVPSPFAVLTDLAQSKDMDLLAIPEDKIEQMTSSNPGLVRAILTKGTYKGLDHDVVTVQSPLVVIANKDAPVDLVYQVTKTIYDNLNDLKKNRSCFETGGSGKPAGRYWRSDASWGQEIFSGKRIIEIIRCKTNVTWCGSTQDYTRKAG